MLHGKVGFIKEPVMNYCKYNMNWWAECDEDLQRQYFSLNYVRIAGLIARQQGVNIDTVKQWEKQVIAILMCDLMQRYCIPKAQQGELSIFHDLFQHSMEQGDMDALFTAMEPYLLHICGNSK